ncbi:MAG TPA: PIN domain-containing protein [archaeon]|nr:PIN domain-containing protein [archaeon]
MQIVVDANPLIALLIRPSKIAELLFLEELEMFAPELLFHEIERNKGIIVQKSGLNESEIDKFILILKKRIKIITEEEFLKFRQQADKICLDEKDVTYFALALYLKCPVWSNEKKLKEQNAIRVYATHELLEVFGIKM